MGSLVSVLVQPLATIIGSIYANFQSLMNIQGFREIIRILGVFVLVYLQYLYFFLMLRYILYWFPNINPYTVPYIYILMVTSPFERFFEKYVPVLFGLPFGFFLLIQLLNNVISTLKPLLASVSA